MGKDNQPKDQQPSPSQPAENPKPVKAPPEIKPDESTRMRFQGSEDLKTPNLVDLAERLRRKK